MGVIAILDVLLGMRTTQFEAGAKRAQATLSNLSSSVAALAGPIAGIAATAMSLNSMHQALEAAATQAGAVRDLNSVLAATGNAAGLSSGEIQKFASDLQTTTRFADEVTTKAAAMLATFTNIKTPAMFKETIKLAQDLSQLTGNDLVASVEQLGRILNDPGGAAKGLKKLGVTPEQRELIVHLAKTQSAAAAQGAVLDALKGKFEGVAEAAGKGLGGQLAQLNNRMDDMREQLGFVLQPFIKSTLTAIDITRGHGQALTETAVAVGVFTASLTVCATAAKAWAATMAIAKAFLGPIGWTELAISAGVAAGAVALLNHQLNQLAEEENNAGGALPSVANGLQQTADAAGEVGNKIRDAEKSLAKFTETQQNKAEQGKQGWSDERAQLEQLARLVEQTSLSKSISGTDVRVDKARKALAENEAVEKRLKIEKELADFQRQASEINLDAAGKQLAALEALKLNDTQRAQADKIAATMRAGEALKKTQEEAKQHRKQLEESAKQLIEKSRTPAQALLADLEKIRQARAANLMTEEQATRAIDLAKKDHTKDLLDSFSKINPGSGAFVKGSAAAFSAEQAASRQANPWKLLTDKQQAQLREMQGQTLLLRSAVKSLENIRAFKMSG